MPFTKTKTSLQLTAEEKISLENISKSRTEEHSRVERAKMLLYYYGGKSINEIAIQLSTNRNKVNSLINKALQIGAIASLNDLKRSGKPVSITGDAIALIISIACQKPTAFEYSQELWSLSLMATHIRRVCVAQGYPELLQIQKGTLSKILNSREIKPHKIKYYLHKRDEQFAEKMAQVLFVYKEVQTQLESANAEKPVMTAYISYDEKPGIQAIGNTVKDRMPNNESGGSIMRDSEYKRHGTLSLLAGIDLLTGRIIAEITERHRSMEFVNFLKTMNEVYAEKEKIRVILDNHTIHISKETRKYLGTVPNRFEFIFTPKHGSWLNIIESFFSKMARVFLRGIRVQSKEELRQRIVNYIAEVNAEPVIFRWKYKMDEITTS